MIEWVTSWAQGIIIAVIIATIIEMILPDGNCKKYIKVVIGVYILFSIISPVITKITGKDFNISEEFNLDEFYAEADSKSIYNELNSNNSNNIMDIYITNLKSDITAKLKNKGYEVISCNIEIKDEETYEISSLNLSLKKINENDNNKNESSNNNINKVEKVEEINEISISIEKNNKEDNEKDSTNTSSSTSTSNSTNTSNSENKTNNENNVNSGDNETTKNYNTDLTAYEKNNRHRHRRHKVRGNPWISFRKRRNFNRLKEKFPHNSRKPANGGGAFF